VSAAPLRGAAGEVHTRDLPVPGGPGVAVWWIQATAPALVLGSRQARLGASLVDETACARDGVEVVRRRSGGGTVWLAPGAHVWVDLVIARADARWDDDVTRACAWVGEAWRVALVAEGLVAPPDLEVHRGGPTGDASVCFAAVGPGEVLLGGAKLVGVSQRRSRAGARFQCVVHAAWDAEAYRRYGPGLGDPPAVGAGSGRVAVLPVLADPARVRALLDRLAEGVGAP
jgi:lipoate-protein ligase A